MKNKEIWLLLLQRENWNAHSRFASAALLEQHVPCLRIIFHVQNHLISHFVLLQCPGYTRKEGDDWLYSRTTEGVLYDYLTKFEHFLVDFVANNLSKEKLSADSAFPTDT